MPPVMLAQLQDDLGWRDDLAVADGLPQDRAVMRGELLGAHDLSLRSLIFLLQLRLLAQRVS